MTRNGAPVTLNEPEPTSARPSSWVQARVRGVYASLGEKGSFRRNAVTATAGTLIAQALPLALYPVFTRLYAPAAFGVFATLSLFATIVAIVSTGSYEQAVIIARSRREASHIIAYALARSAVVLGVVLALALFLQDR